MKLVPRPVVKIARAIHRKRALEVSGEASAGRPGAAGAALRRRITALAFAVGALLALLTAVESRAHTVGHSYLYLQVYEDRVSGRFEVALDDLNPALGLAGTEGEITAENLDEHVPFLQSYYREKVTISGPRGPLEFQFKEHDLLGGHHGYVLLPFELPGLEEVPDSLAFDYSVLFDEDPGHQGFVLVEYNWATGTFANEGRISLAFSPEDRRQELELTTSARWQGFKAVMRLGMEHVWEGIELLLFLIAILLPAVLRREDGRWQPVERLGPALIRVILTVTAFTVAHSLTLSLASFGIVSLPGGLVEVLIAASITLAAADLVYPILRGRIWLLAAGFGLFHGFGFAEGLAEMGVLREHAGLSLLAFNLGVEIGQVAVVAVLTPILFLLRRWKLYRKVGLPAAAVFLILVSGVWVVERTFGVDVPMYELLPAPLQEIIP